MQVNVVVWWFGVNCIDRKGSSASISKTRGKYYAIATGQQLNIHGCGVNFSIYSGSAYRNILDSALVNPNWTLNHVTSREIYIIILGDGD